MNVPPASPPSPMAAPPPPPPPPRKSSLMTWVLVGCGCVLFLGIAAVGSCIFLARKAVMYAEQAGRAWTELGEKHIRNNAIVRKHLGEVRSVTQGRQRGRNTGKAIMPYRVVGEDGEGDVDIEVEVKGAGDIFNPKVIASQLYYNGKRIDLATGKETEARAPTPEPSPTDDEND